MNTRNPYLTPPYLTPRELGTVLAALRLLQRQRTDFDGLPDEVVEIATNGGSLQALRNDEIDFLCDRLNVYKD